MTTFTCYQVITGFIIGDELSVRENLPDNDFEGIRVDEHEQLTILFAEFFLVIL